MGRMFPERPPGRAAEREQLGVSRRSPATVGAVSGTAAEPIPGGGSSARIASCRGGLGWHQGQAEAAAREWKGQIPAGAVRSHCRRRDPAAARPERPTGARAYLHTRPAIFA